MGVAADSVDRQTWRDFVLAVGEDNPVVIDRADEIHRVLDEIAVAERLMP